MAQFFPFIAEDDDFFDVLSAASSVQKWEELGLALKLKPTLLKDIGKNHIKDISECRKEMFRLWLKEGTATWKNLCLALDNDLVGEKNLARDIAKNHLYKVYSQPEEETGSSKYPQSSVSSANSSSMETNTEQGQLLSNPTSQPQNNDLERH